MLENKRQTPTNMIDPKEACELAWNYGSLQDYRMAMNVYEEFHNLHAEWYQKDRKWYIATLCITLFAAGRLQGIREERAKKKAKKACFIS